MFIFGSGVTKVGVIRAATEGVTYFFLKKLTTLLYKAIQSDDLISCRLVTIPTFRRRLSSVLSKFSHNK